MISIGLTEGDGEMLFYTRLKARSSGGERYLDTVEVPGSKPGGPTITKKEVTHLRQPLFFCHCEANVKYASAHSFQVHC